MRRIRMLVSVLALTSVVGACDGIISGPVLEWDSFPGAAGGGGGPVVWVMKAPTDVVLVGDTLRFVMYRQTPAGLVQERADSFRWRTLDTTVAVVDTLGLVTGVRPGATTVHAEDRLLGTSLAVGSIQVR